MIIQNQTILLVGKHGSDGSDI